MTAQELGKQCAFYMGLTKREYFAAMALQGMLAGFMQAEGWHDDSFAIEAVRQADYLLEVLAGKNEQPETPKS